VADGWDAGVATAAPGAVRDRTATVGTREPARLPEESPGRSGLLSTR